MIREETRPSDDQPAAPELSREALAAAVKIADDWVQENRDNLEMGGDGDLEALVRALYRSWRQAT